MCWMVGNKLVTVTTSGCSQKILKNGLCDKCWGLCNAQNDSRQSKSARSGSNETEDIGEQIYILLLFIFHIFSIFSHI